ncbi:MAG: aldehyde dehydrogenase family protein [Actinomycetota bacterium]|nr:aldehyde dehydrogenase family protein [Actinomycetota bacterium]
MSTIDPQEEWRLLVGGEWVSAGSTYPVVDPWTTETVGHAPDAGVDAAQAAVAAAREALPGWRSTPIAERCAMLGRLADLLTARAPDWATLVQAETGSTISITETLQVAGGLIDRFRYYSKPRDLDTAELPLAQGASALGAAGLIGASVHRQPVGVVLCITPYNFPLTNVAGKIAPALAMGNTCIIKPAPQDPLGILRLGEAIVDAGFPAGVVNIVTSSSAEAPASMVTSPEVNMVSFTGSTAVGKAIYADGAATMTRALMELGGKGALVMTDDADVDAAVRAIATVWGFHSGQICTAPTRVICHRSLYDRTVEALEAVAGMLTPGDPTDRGTLVGPLISEAQRDRVEAFVASGVEDGATLVSGGGRPDLPGWFVAPTLLADCTADMAVVREEAFGPVVVVLPHDGDDEAVALANDSDYGLFSYVYSGDLARAYGIGRRLETGNVALNSIQPHMEAPFGGFKMSGIGRDRGVWGLMAYSELQAVSWLA